LCIWWRHTTLCDVIRHWEIMFTRCKVLGDVIRLCRKDDKVLCLTSYGFVWNHSTLRDYVFEMKGFGWHHTTFVWRHLVWCFGRFCVGWSHTSWKEWQGFVSLGDLKRFRVTSLNIERLCSWKCRILDDAMRFCVTSYSFMRRMIRFCVLSTLCDVIQFREKDDKVLCDVIQFREKDDKVLGNEIQRSWVMKYNIEVYNYGWHHTTLCFGYDVDSSMSFWPF